MTREQARAFAREIGVRILKPPAINERECWVERIVKEYAWPSTQ